jgi:hypothetical protein
MAPPLTTVNPVASVAGKRRERSRGETVCRAADEFLEGAALHAIEHRGLASFNRSLAPFAGHGDSPANGVEHRRLQVVDPRVELSDGSAALAGKHARDAVIACGDQEAAIPAEPDIPDRLTNGQDGDEAVRMNVPDPSRP